MKTRVTIKDLLLHHLEYTFEKEAWQPSLAMATEGVTAQQALWKPAAERHSIWQIAWHVTHWKRATLGAWDGSRPLFRAGSGSTEFLDEAERTDWQEVSGDESTWQADCQALHEVSRTIAERAAAMTEEQFLQPFPGEDMPAALRLLRMATHDIYHAGQIRYLRVLQGV